MLSMLLANVGFSQLGINVENPQAMVHVDGDVQVTNSLVIGGNDRLIGNAGKKGALFMSQGEGKSAVWATPLSLNIPSVSVIAKTNGAINTIPARKEIILKYNSHERIDSELLRYDDSTGKYTILRAGYYLINANASISVSSLESNTDGSLTFGLDLNNQKTLSVLVAFPNSAPNPIRESLSGIYYMNVNDHFYMRLNFTRRYNFINSNISVTYLFNP